MRQRLIFFLVVLLLIFQGEIFGQVKPAGLSGFQGYHLYINPDFGTSIRAAGEIQPKETTIKLLRPAFSYVGIGQSFYSEHLGFFCQKELQLQKITSLPIRFRLGSLDYVNWMEQKPNAIKPF